MRNFFKFLGLTALVAVIGLSMAACRQDGGDDDDDPYKMNWGSWDSGYYDDVRDYVGTGNGFIEVITNNAGYVTGSKATDAYNKAKSYPVHDSGIKTGEWSDLVNFSKDGISAPAALKTAMLGQEGNVPLGGVFEASGYTLVFYITRN